MEFYNNYFPLPKTMMVCETDVQNPIGFVHFKPRDQRFADIEAILIKHDERKDNATA